MGKSYSKPRSKGNNFDASQAASIWKNIHKQHLYEECHPELQQSSKLDEQVLLNNFEAGQGSLVFLKPK